jgi:hypothetical protein
MSSATESLAILAASSTKVLEFLHLWVKEKMVIRPIYLKISIGFESFHLMDQE